MCSELLIYVPAGPLAMAKGPCELAADCQRVDGFLNGGDHVFAFLAH